MSPESIVAEKIPCLTSKVIEHVSHTRNTGLATTIKHKRCAITLSEQCHVSDVDKSGGTALIALRSYDSPGLFFI